MTTGQYKRLCLVLFVPLLLAGFFVGQKILNDERYLTLLCSPIGDKEFCTPSGPLGGNFYERTKSRINYWFQVYPASDKEPALFSVIAEASGRVISDALIQSSVKNIATSEQGKVFMDSLNGLKASILLGSKEASVITENGIALSCNSLRFTETEGVYSSYCYGAGWSGEFSYKASEQDKIKIDVLRASFYKEIASYHFSRVMGMVILYPMFIYIFLLLSLTFWLIKKAARFVKG